MSNRNLAFPLTAAALAVLLAACGSDSGSPDSSGAAPKDAPAPLAEKAPQGPLIDATGVRGDLLLSMMDHRVCHHKTLRPATSHDGSGVNADAADVKEIEARYGLSPSNYPRIPGSPIPMGAVGHDIPCTPSLHSYSPFSEGTSRLEQSTAGSTFRGVPDLSKLRPFPRIETSTPVTVSGDTVTLGAEQQFDRANAQLTLISASAYSFRTGDRVPYGLLSEWRQGDTFTEVMLLPANNSTQAKLCWNVHTSDVRRLHCSVWEVPEGWERGRDSTLNLQDQYVIDDRSLYPGEAGHRFWRGNF